MAEKEESFFRKKAMDRISSPEDLNRYLKVTGPGMWMILAAIIMLLIGLFAWSAVGTLETSTEASVVVEGHTARVILSGQGSDPLEAGMPLRIAGQKFYIASVDYDEYGRATGYAEVALPDGSYEASVVTDETHPVEFLLESR